MTQLLLTLIVTLFAAVTSADVIEVSIQTDGNIKKHSPPLSLKYWNGRGLMEVSRMILAVAGKFPGDYEDGRFDSPPKGLKSNLGRMPVMSVGSADIGQSAAIHYYLAAENDLMGSSTLEAAQILSIKEHVSEMSDVYRSLVAYGEEPSDAVTVQWFEGGATDVLGTADYSKRGGRYLTWWMGRIEQALDAEGFAIGGKLSLADLYLYNSFQEVLRDEEVTSEEYPRWSREPFGHYEAVSKKLAEYPRLSASCEAVAKNANVQKWLEMRGKQSF